MARLRPRMGDEPETPSRCRCGGRGGLEIDRDVAAMLPTARPGNYLGRGAWRCGAPGGARMRLGILTRPPYTLSAKSLSGR